MECCARSTRAARSFTDYRPSAASKRSTCHRTGLPSAASNATMSGTVAGGVTRQCARMTALTRPPPVQRRQRTFMAHDSPVGSFPGEVLNCLTMDGVDKHGFTVDRRARKERKENFPFRVPSPDAAQSAGTSNLSSSSKLMSREIHLSSKKSLDTASKLQLVSIANDLTTTIRLSSGELLSSKPSDDFSAGIHLISASATDGQAAIRLTWCKTTETTESWKR